MSNSDWKSRLNVVYSTNPDYSYQTDNAPESQTLPPARQTLRVQIDKRRRAGKVVTLITGFIGKQEDLELLGKLLKSKCGVGGTAKEGEIIVQGDHKQKVADLLLKEGYKVKIVN